MIHTPRGLSRTAGRLTLMRCMAQDGESGKRGDQPEILQRRSWLLHAEQNVVAARGLQMNAEERSLIIGLFDRMSKLSDIEKDHDAAELIDGRVRRNPDAAYLLTQSVLVQEQALQRADARIRELEQELSRAKADASQASETSSSFLGNSRSTSVPTTNPARNNIGDRSATGGGFMAQALSTAAGVAGGMLLASGISSLLGGDSASAATAQNAASDSGPATPAADTNAAAEPAGGAEHGNESVHAMDAVDESEPGMEDVGWDDWGDFGDDLDI